MIPSAGSLKAGGTGIDLIAASVDDPGLLKIFTPEDLMELLAFPENV